MSSAAQTLIRTRVKPHSAFAQFADGAIVVSSKLDDPHGTLTRRYLGLAQKATGTHRNTPAPVTVMRDRSSSLFDLLISPDDTAFRREFIDVNNEEKPGAAALRARDEDIALDTNLKLVNQDDDDSDAGRMIKGHIKRKNKDDRQADELLRQFLLSGPVTHVTAEVKTEPQDHTPVMTPEQLRLYILQYRQSQLGLQHFHLAA